MNLADLEALSKEVRARGLAFHLDGARAWNALVARGQWGDSDALRRTATCSTAFTCLSKGLGYPVGSVLVGPQPFIQKPTAFAK